MGLGAGHATGTAAGGRRSLAARETAHHTCRSSPRIWRSNTSGRWPASTALVRALNSSARRRAADAAIRPTCPVFSHRQQRLCGPAWPRRRPTPPPGCTDLLATSERTCGARASGRQAPRFRICALRGAPAQRSMLKPWCYAARSMRVPGRGPPAPTALGSRKIKQHSSCGRPVTANKRWQQVRFQRRCSLAWRASCAQVRRPIQKSTSLSSLFSPQSTEPHARNAWCRLIALPCVAQGSGTTFCAWAGRSGGGMVQKGGAEDGAPFYEPTCAICE